MGALWEAGPLSTPAVYDRVGRPRQLAYTTILTVLQRLHRKGLASRQSAGKLHIYEATMTREQFSGQRGHDLASVLVGLGASGMAAFLVEAERLDPDFVARLREHLGKKS